MNSQVIVVVEDEADLREAVVDYLFAKGYEAIGASDGNGLRGLVAERDVDLVLLDLALPGEDGLSLCRWLRREIGCGVIMATGSAQPIDRVVGLEVGADDYVVKPYDLRELLARVRSVLRRVARPEPAEGPPVPASPAIPAPPAPRPGAPPLAFGSFLVMAEGRQLVDAEGRDVALTGAEFDLVRIFAERPGRLLTRGTIARIADGRDLDPADRSIDIRIARLRKKLEAAGGGTLIRTVRGEGYRYDPSGS